MCSKTLNCFKTTILQIQPIEFYDYIVLTNSFSFGPYFWRDMFDEIVHQNDFCILPEGLNLKVYLKRNLNLFDVEQMFTKLKVKLLIVKINITDPKALSGYSTKCGRTRVRSIPFANARAPRN
jgi:hypothetical protein